MGFPEGGNHEYADEGQPQGSQRQAQAGKEQKIEEPGAFFLQLEHRQPQAHLAAFEQMLDQALGSAEDALHRASGTLHQRRPISKPISMPTAAPRPMLVQGCSRT